MTSLLVARHGFAIGPILNLICAVILVLSISSDHHFFFFTFVPAVLPCLAITLNVACLGLGQVYKDSNSSLVSVRIGVVLTGIIAVIASSPLFYFMELNLRFGITPGVKRAIFSLHPSLFSLHPEEVYEVFSTSLAGCAVVSAALGSVFTGEGYRKKTVWKTDRLPSLDEESLEDIIEQVGEIFFNVSNTRISQ